MSNDPTADGLSLITIERARQLRKHTREDDNLYNQGGVLARRAAELALATTDLTVTKVTEGRRTQVEIPMEVIMPPDEWNLVAKHRRDKVRQLMLAGALIAAEIDRLLDLQKGASSDAE